MVPVNRSYHHGAKCVGANALIQACMAHVGAGSSHEMSVEITREFEGNLGPLPIIPGREIFNVPMDGNCCYYAVICSAYNMRYKPKYRSLLINDAMNLRRQVAELLCNHPMFANVRKSPDDVIAHINDKQGTSMSTWDDFIRETISGVVWPDSNSLRAIAICMKRDIVIVNMLEPRARKEVYSHDPAVRGTILPVDACVSFIPGVVVVAYDGYAHYFGTVKKHV
eukprot:358362-Chlamydomonas_euryale.AAC.3